MKTIIWRIKKKPLTFVFAYSIYCLLILYFYQRFDPYLGDAKYYVDIDLIPLSILNNLSIPTILTQVLLSSLPDNIFSASVILTIITSLVFYLKLNKFLFLRGSYLLWITILTPGFALWSSAPSKESVFIIISLFYICFEVRNLVEKSFNEINQGNLFLIRFMFIFLFIFLRGRAAIPYLVLGFSISLFPFFSFFLKKIKRIKNITFYFLSFSSLIAISIIFVVNELDLEYISTFAPGLKGSFLGQGGNLSREFLSSRNPFNLRNFIIMPYLSFFPTLDEIISNKLLFLIIIDSVLYISVYFIIWNKLLNTRNLSNLKIKFLQFIFLSITILYILIYPLSGAYNLGSALRNRQNFVNIGHIFPILIIYSLRIKENNLKYSNKNKAFIDYQK